MYTMKFYLWLKIWLKPWLITMTETHTDIEVTLHESPFSPFHIIERSVSLFLQTDNSFRCRILLDGILSESLQYNILIRGLNPCFFFLGDFWPNSPKTRMLPSKLEFSAARLLVGFWSGTSLWNHFGSVFLFTLRPNAEVLRTLKS